MKAPFIEGSGGAQHNASMTFLTNHSSIVHLAKRGVVLACLVGGAALVATPLFASDRGDHDRARQAVQSGQVLPLPAVLERLQREVPGQVLEVELEQERGTWIYEIKLITPAGELTKVELDAGSAKVLRIKSRDDRRQ